MRDFAADSKVSEQRDDGGDDHSRYAGREEERNDWNERADCGGQCSRYGGDHRFTEAFLRRVQALACQRPNKLILVLRDVVYKSLRIFLRQSPDLKTKGEEFSRLCFVVLDCFLFPCEFGVVDLSLAFGCKVGTRAHRQGARGHACEAGDEDEVTVA